MKNVYHFIEVLLVIFVIVFLFRGDVALAQVSHKDVDIGERLLADWTFLDVRADSFGSLKM